MDGTYSQAIVGANTEMWTLFWVHLIMVERGPDLLVLSNDERWTFFEFINPKLKNGLDFELIIFLNLKSILESWP